MTDPKAILKEPEYQLLGPLGIIGFLKKNTQIFYLSHHVLDHSVRVPTGPPEVTMTEAFAQHVWILMELSFLGYGVHC